MRCENCMVFKRGDCGGVGCARTCKDYEGAPTVTAYEIDLWPKCGDATVYRTKDNAEKRNRGLFDY